MRIPMIPMVRCASQNIGDDDAPHMFPRHAFSDLAIKLWMLWMLDAVKPSR